MIAIVERIFARLEIETFSARPLITLFTIDLVAHRIK